MKVVRLGQAGLLFDDGTAKILIDPWFTDSAFEASGVHRKKEAPAWVWDIKPDIILITHCHIDHYDPETFEHYVNQNTAVTVLSPRSVWEKARLTGGGNNFVLVSPGVVWTQKGVTVVTEYAKHSDDYAVGYTVTMDGKRLYVTGDTLYDLRLSATGPVDYVFLPVNGRGNNMNAADAAKLAKDVGAKHAVPVHYGMLDDVSPDIFEYDGKTVFEDFKEYDI